MDATHRVTQGSLYQRWRLVDVTPVRTSQEQPIHPLTPEVIDPRIADVEAMARWFDYAFRIPGGFRFGLAGIIGLIPGIGDIIDALISLYIVFRAIQLRISRVAITRMLVNIGLEASLGVVPLLGDLFVVGYKANRRNYQLLRRHLLDPRRQSARDWWFLALTFALLVACFAVPVALIVFLLRKV
jgi:hypothetical protein